jgi:hypothetical protein
MECWPLRWRPRIVPDGHGRRKEGAFHPDVSDHIFTGEGLSAMERQESFREMMEIALDIV